MAEPAAQIGLPALWRLTEALLTASDGFVQIGSSRAIAREQPESAQKAAQHSSVERFAAFFRFATRARKAMAIDINRENLLTFQEAVARLPNQRHVRTLSRWRTDGVRGIKLEAVRIGGSWYTSAEALARFVALCSIETEPAGELAEVTI